MCVIFRFLHDSDAGQPDVAKVLIQNRANVNAADIFARIPLHLAVKDRRRIHY